MVALVSPAPQAASDDIYAARLAQAATAYSAAERAAIEATFELARKRYGDALTS